MIETKQYEEYKDSGIEWVGTIPMGWQTRPLFAVVRANTELNKAGAESNLLSLSYGRIIRKDITANDGLLPASFDTYQVIRQNDIVLRLTDLQNDKRSLRSAISPERGIITSAYLAVTPTCVLPNYLSYLLRAYDLQKVFYSMGGGLRQSMKYSDMKWLPIILPPESTQRAIVDFLDQQTSQIDELIGKQERLIELLTEKRQAIITHAITKGLDPNAPIKPSGIPWIGEIPITWTVTSIKRVASLFVPQRDKPDLNKEGGYPWITSVNLGQPDLVNVDTFVTESAAKRSQSRILRSGSVLATCVGRFGLASVCHEDVVINQQIHGLIPSEKIQRQFLRYVVFISRSYFESIATLTTISYVNGSGFENMPVALPPLAIQDLILREVDCKISKIDAVLVNSQRVVALLRERRSALISAAVTGKVAIETRGTSA